MNKRAILCVDDEAIILFSIKQELKSRFREQYIYETAFNGEEALDIIADLDREGIEIAVIISDWLMPGLKGDDLFRIVKEKNPDVKTVLVTGHASPDALEGLKNDSLTNAIIIKPWRENDLISVVEQCTGS
jgi:YesN/AraC family two-component response regulator